MAPDSGGRCPCGTGHSYATCCGPVHDGAPAPTAEVLMRSRYSAFVLGDVAHLRRSWARETRPEDVGIDPRLRWTRLRVIEVVGGGGEDDTGSVEFRAHYRIDGDPDVLYECSHFERRDGHWVYVSGRAVTR